LLVSHKNPSCSKYWLFHLSISQPAFAYQLLSMIEIISRPTTALLCP